MKTVPLIPVWQENFILSVFSQALDFTKEWMNCKCWIHTWNALDSISLQALYCLEKSYFVKVCSWTLPIYRNKSRIECRNGFLFPIFFLYPVHTSSLSSSTSSSFHQGPHYLFALNIYTWPLLCIVKSR